MNHRPLRAGDVLLLTRTASPQFTQPITVRVIRELTDRHTYQGWVWITAYQLDAAHQAVRRRELYVRRDGLHWLPAPTPPAPRPRTSGTPPVRRTNQRAPTARRGRLPGDEPTP
ncbi:hypothetical protein [Micromonospora sp. WMMD987]|uniref:hypothetical protein n=1 Tax=Micromonospora sp. WMMD987 TaxID=3016089 RepID=UPI002499FC10|nr:hypothetical protein [Micromonospora sp. WMMD987]WFE98218.1 hypothetical protein O7612_17750 [Micromonospora sp. WMMD987]